MHRTHFLINFLHWWQKDGKAKTLTRNTNINNFKIGFESICTQQEFWFTMTGVSIGQLVVNVQISHPQ
jgi:hypothetical protein